ncbi:MAG: hypothetical protein ABW022_27845 [Actinoplanes sp.]
MRQIEQNMVRSSTWTWAPVPAGVAFVSAVLLVLVHWNVADLAFLNDHPLPALIFWPALWVLLAVTVSMLIPSDLRSAAATAWVFGGTGLVVLLAGCVGLAVATLGGGSPGRGERVDHMSSADGRYRVEVFYWEAMLGEPGWDVIISRRDGLRNTEAFAGCLYSESAATYKAVQSVEAGSARIVTEEGLISIAFDPNTMRATERIPAELCAGYE